MERSLFADVFYHLVTCSFNWKLNGSRKENMYCSLWNENDQSCRQGLRCYFQDFYYGSECLLVNQLQCQFEFRLNSC